jgi:hypothetical protein
LKDAGKNEAVRDKYDDTRHNEVFSPYSENLYLINIGAGAKQLEQREDITEIVVDGVSIIECQSQDTLSINHGIRKCHPLWGN